MIQALVDAAVTRLREQLGDALGAADRVVAGPAAAPGAGALPLVVLAAGHLEVLPPHDEGLEGGARPREVRQQVPATPAAPGPHPLDHAPLEGSARGRLVLAPETVAERREPLFAGADFTVDEPDATVTFSVDLAARAAAHAARVADQVQARVGHAFNLDSPKQLSGALFDDLKLPPQGPLNAQGYYSTDRTVLEKLRDADPVVPLVIAYRDLGAGTGFEVWLDYAYAGLFTEREFRQFLWVDAYDAAPGGAERWGSLAAAVLLTYSDELLAARTEYPSRKSVSALHQLTRLELVDGEPAPFDAGTRLRLGFRVTGKLTLVRQPPQSAAIIRRIVSPGLYTPDGVAVEPDLG
ncbi:MAG TPA: DNA polymerase [Longimicrobium sp.]|nr:DNA polymerase [Longimicrobium sp.]